MLPESGNGHPTVASAVARFLEETELTKKPKALAAYTTALNYFTESCRKFYVHEIDSHDLLKFSGFLRNEKKQSPRSTYNKFETVMTFLKANAIRGLVGKNDWPRYTEEEPEMYEQDELDKLFQACSDEERLWFEFFLRTGMREQEVMYTYWPDVNFTASTVRVSHKPDRNWTPKAYKEREIPIPAKLVKKLKGRKAKADKTSGLVFPTSGCNPKLDFLDCLKSQVGQGRFLAAQVSFDICNALPVGWCRSMHSTAVVGPLRYGIHDAVSETLAQSANARKSQ